MSTIETDYLVVGAGASGMAFADALIDASDADIVMVDRRHRPGGHWNDAYPFVRLHQPSACYGVNSLTLGADRIDETGPNAGFYERATTAEICHYYERVLEEVLLPSNQVWFLGMRDYLGESADGHLLASRLTGERTTVRVRRRLVNAAYLEAAVPATHRPSFEIAPDVRLFSPSKLVELSEPGTRFTVLGSGKTGMDTCSFLLDSGVTADAIRWIKPREAWVLDRANIQPKELVTSFMEGISYEVLAAAQAEDAGDLFRRLEASGQLHRLDPQVEPTMFRGAILSGLERERLRSIRDVVRLGRVVRLETDRIVLETGSVPADRTDVYIDCTAAGLSGLPARAIFEPGRITVQSIQFGIVPFSAALIGYIEATREDDAEKNRLCPPNRHANTALDWIRTTLTLYHAQQEWEVEPDVQAWLERSRLNIGRGVSEYLDDPRMVSAIDRITGNWEPAVAGLERLLEESQRPL